MVRDLARRGDLARQRAEERLLEKPFFDPESVRGLALPFQSSMPSAREPKLYALRAAPLTVGPVFRDRALTESFTNYLVRDILPELRPAYDELLPPVIPHSQHEVAVYEQSRHLLNNSVALVAVAVNNLRSVELHSTRATDTIEVRRLELDAQEQMYFQPMLTAMTQLLAALEAVGSCRFILDLETPTDSSVRQGQQAGPLRGTRVQFTRDLGIPAAEDAVQRHAAACRRQLARAGGLTAWEPERR
jgi:hypothetical protein